MIRLKAFVEAIHEAIINANNTLMDKNVGLLEKYFRKERPSDSLQNITSEHVNKDRVENSPPNTTSGTDNLVSRNVVLSYPVYSENGIVHQKNIQVPLITMVPLGMSQIEKATLTAEFELALVDDELQLHFPNSKKGGLFNKKDINQKTTNGKLEIVISPQEPSEGLKLVVEAYEASLKRQIV